MNEAKLAGAILLFMVLIGCVIEQNPPPPLMVEGWKKIKKDMGFKS